MGERLSGVDEGGRSSCWIALMPFGTSAPKP